MKPTVKTKIKLVGNSTQPRLRLRRKLLCAFAGVGLLFTVSPAIQAQDCPTSCDGNGNSSLGIFALVGITSGTNDTAIGQAALEFTTSGFDNTGIGMQALFSNTIGSANTAIGSGSLLANTMGS